MRRFSWLLICLVLLAAASAHAERIYRLVDYPALQNGFTLSGTIKTTDEAAQDSLLDASEIQDWEWAISGPTNYSVAKIPASVSLSSGIQISPSEILLPLFDEGYLAFFPLNPGVPIARLNWTNVELNGGLLSSYSAGYDGFDSIVPIWQSSLSGLTSTHFVIAVAVPEPLSSMIACWGILGAVIGQRATRSYS